jgi:hypothetical protein
MGNDYADIVTLGTQIPGKQRKGVHFKYGIKLAWTCKIQTSKFLQLIFRLENVNHPLPLLGQHIHIALT